MRSSLMHRIAAVLVMATLSVAAASAQPAEPAAAGGAPGLDLTTPVWQNLHRLQETWQLWVNAYHRNDPDQAEAAVEEILSIVDYLGMSTLPELSVAAAAHAVRASREGDGARAMWALEASRQLDPERPETQFAEASVHRLEGNPLSAVVSELWGYIRILQLPRERALWVQNIGIWLLYVVILAGGLLIALQMGLRGGEVLKELAGVLPEPVPPGVATVLAVVLLIWPLFLPSGVLWLALYWSVLLWGYGTASERSVLVVLWLVMGSIPFLLGLQQRSMQLNLSPPSRAISAISAGQLYGTLFSDLAVLGSMIPEHPAVLELIGDLHRRLGQWEYARTIYDELREHPDQTPHDISSALNNLGVYYHRKGDYGTAINYFRAAVEADNDSVEALYNLSQAFSLEYSYDDAEHALADARALDSARVDEWIDLKGDDPAEAVVQIDGGLERTREIREALVASWRGEGDPDRSGWSVTLGVVVALCLLALTLQVWRRRSGKVPSSERVLPSSTAGRWLRALVPGFASAARGRGGQAFFGLLVFVAILTLPLMNTLGYRVPLGYDPGTYLALVLSGVALLFWVAIRVARELTS